jgi:hypothetical protein
VCCYSDCCYGECHYAYCNFAYFFMLTASNMIVFLVSVVMLWMIMFSFVNNSECHMLDVNILRVFTLRILMLSTSVSLLSLC